MTLIHLCTERRVLWNVLTCTQESSTYLSASSSSQGIALVQGKGCSKLRMTVGFFPSLANTSLDATSLYALLLLLAAFIVNRSAIVVV